MGEDFVPTFAAVVITSAGECPSCGQWTKEHFGVQALEKAEWHRVADKWAGFVKGPPVISVPLDVDGTPRAAAVWSPVRHRMLFDVPYVACPACGALCARRRAATGNASTSSMRDRLELVGVDRMIVLKQEEIRRYEEHLGSEIRRYDHRASASTSSETMTVAQSVSVAVTVGTELAETDMGGLQIREVRNRPTRY
jgi:hypothetical protein